MKLKNRLDLQAKIVLILVAVIIPTFVIVTFAQNKLTQPIFEEEFRQLGITTAKTLAAEIAGSRWLSLPNPTPTIENHIQTLVYSQPNIVRIDVLVKDPVTGMVKTVATNVEEEPGVAPSPFFVADSINSEYKLDETGEGTWEIDVPIEQASRDPRGHKRLLGSVHLVISLKLLGQIVSTLWRTTATAAAFTVVTLLLVLSYLLRKTIINDRLLRQAENQNLQLAEQLHDAQRQLMNTEKLAVMGQLTASFAHEIGSPLNAIGGHLQLLKEEGAKTASQQMTDRLDIINSQVSKIEEIVRGFLQSTSKPASQRQLSDINQLVDRTLEIVQPRSDRSGVEVQCELDRRLGPMRIVPLDFEQIMLNLLNNSLDSLRSKSEKLPQSKLELRVLTQLVKDSGKDWAEVSVYDTGEGIKKPDLGQVLKPFFTTKRPGEGTGLGLPICQQLVRKYGGRLAINSREGEGTEVTFRIPYHV
jgi:signal transduction histidine kinase